MLFEVKVVTFDFLTQDSILALHPLTVRRTWIRSAASPVGNVGKTTYRLKEKIIF
jgi:hypothetical protein